MRLARIHVAVVAALVLTMRPYDAFAEGTAKKTVERLNASIAEILPKAEQLGYAGRFERLKPVMAEAFDVDFMAEKSLGRHWKDLSDEQKKQWTDAFREFTIANYAANLDRNTGQRFELLGEEPAEHDTVVVRGRVVDPAAAPFDLNYRLHRTPKGPRIIDVQLKGTVSELALRR
ncbi:MAG TPA: ABC transporter substrate-binding protein, partial [Candidatus Eisenbacteria bacterium]|nr:ABC transporter substrate-binding protein [Candidatus Eisenbacteria bacterium]